MTPKKDVTPKIARATMSTPTPIPDLAPRERPPDAEEGFDDGKVVLEELPEVEPEVMKSRNTRVALIGMIGAGLASVLQDFGPPVSILLILSHCNR